jgi:hypothetical protein
MADELMVRQNMALTFDEMTRAAKAMALSGYFTDAREVSQAMVKVMAGAELGLGPFASMTGISIIKGKPVLGANLIATLIKNDPRYDYHITELTETRAVIDFYEYGQKVGTSTFTIEEARASGVGAATPPGKPKSMLEMYPKNMLFARAISNGAKWYTPGIFGGAPVYTPDEFGADVDEEGDPIIDVTPKMVVIDNATGEIMQAPSLVEGEVTFDSLTPPPAAPADSRGEASPAAQAKRAHLRPRPENGGAPDWEARALKARTLREFASIIPHMLPDYKSEHEVVAIMEGWPDFEYDREHTAEFIQRLRELKAQLADAEPEPLFP